MGAARHRPRNRRRHPSGRRPRVSGNDHYASWIPVAPAAEAWRDRLNAASRIPIAERIAFWVEHANGRTLDLAPLETPPDDRQLHDAVEEVLDDLLATGVGE